MNEAQRRGQREADNDPRHGIQLTVRARRGEEDRLCWTAENPTSLSSFWPLLSPNARGHRLNGSPASGFPNRRCGTLVGWPRGSWLAQRPRGRSGALLATRRLEPGLCDANRGAEGGYALRHGGSDSRLILDSRIPFLSVIRHMCLCRMIGAYMARKVVMMIMWKKYIVPVSKVPKMYGSPRMDDWKGHEVAPSTFRLPPSNQRIPIRIQSHTCSIGPSDPTDYSYLPLIWMYL